MKNKLLDTINNTIDFLGNNIPAEKNAMEAETGIQLPDIIDYHTGYRDIFNLENYPSVLVGYDDIEPKPKNEFSEIKLDIVLILMSDDENQLNEWGLLYSDVITNILAENYRMDNTVLDTEIEKIQHYYSDGKYIIDITIRVGTENK